MPNDFTRGMDIGSAAYQKQAEDENLMQRLLKQKQLEAQNKEAEIKAQHSADSAYQQELLNRALSVQRQLGNQYGVTMSKEGVGFTPHDRPPGFNLTPAQKSFETEAGKKVEAFEVAGGKPAADKALGGLDKTLTELGGGTDAQGKPIPSQRDVWDRFVGGSVNKVAPSLMGFFAPSEKSRMDRIRSIVASTVRATDPQPTQALIDQTFAQAYDPASPDEENAARIQALYKQKKAEVDQLSQAGQRIRTTGYANTYGPSATPPPPASGKMSFEDWKKANGR